MLYGGTSRVGFVKTSHDHRPGLGVVSEQGLRYAKMA
jgi:hypothetical protein